MSNFSFVEDENFGDLDPNEIDHSSHFLSILETVYVTVAEILKFFLCFCSGVSSIFLIYVMLRFEKIRRKSSVFLLHYAIASFIDMLLAPAVNIIVDVSANLYGSWHIICALYTTTESTGVLIFVFASALGVFWFIQNFRNDWIQRFPRLLTYFIIVCYLICIASIGYHVFGCFIEITLQSGHISIAFYLILLSITIAINILVRKMQPMNKSFEKTKYQLYVSNYVLISYVPLFLCHYILSEIYNMHIDFMKVVELFFYAAGLYAYSGPIVVNYLLIRKNKYFRAAYSSIFKKSVKDYNEEDMGEESENEGENFQENQNNEKEFTNDAAYAVVI